MQTMDAAVVAHLVKLPGAATTNQDVPKATFQIVTVLKGESLVGKQTRIEALYFGDGQPGQPFLIMGVDPPKLNWTTPLPLSSRGVDYLQKLPTLPEKGADRLAFFMDYLEDKEEMLRSEDRKMRSGLDALIGCYLTLRGADGVALVEDLFLRNKDSEYADTYAAIMALRFHGNETDIIPRKRILQALHVMLDRPELADLVIPDLARWEDWSQIERLAELFVKSDEKNSWVRVPVINYLRACPKPEAKEWIAKLEQVDPQAVKRANTFFPFGVGGGSPPKTPEDSDKTDDGN